MKDHDLYETPADERLQNGLWQGVPELALWERTVLSVRDALAARWQESWEGKVALIGFMAFLLIILIGASYLLGLWWPTFDPSR